MKLYEMKAAVVSSLLFAGTGFGAQSNEMINTEEMPKLLYNSIEISPIAAGLSAEGGVQIISASWEQYIGDKWAGYLRAGYGDVEMDNDFIQEAQEETDGAVLESGYGSSFELGTRYYEDPIGDSWFGSAGVSYSESKSKWVYEESEVQNELYAVTPNIGAGYRWAWNSGFLVRASVGAGFPYVSSESVSATISGAKVEEAIEDVEDYNDQDVIPKLDVGIGYTF
ncbi:hypothetical protein [Pseudobacteriovorax antillogorgiicola]|uniref:Outer membrane protein beta-barrel domain-containing protein n=1 Tax=Pseudobacteriovorax antillogorgiicola TaxID=1513793 RepID=A0A1Y6CMU1_9BACT|nr:hypothetical protein [Pseudobacteriovorax antillogorgiicola]TCS47005.1 hypothetical protein EDD56_122100 [Pseudobacteriovorax antillogorgiicola]SMF64994.1 hypothetical protein SAMN06296036_122100 [Pseudobacteriovorax antillogorgiicola]